MSTKRDSDRQLLARLEASLDRDLLTDAYSDTEIDALIRAEGGDPEDIGRRGAELAESLLRRRRLAWQDAARAARARMEAAIACPDIPPLPTHDAFPALVAAANSAGISLALRDRKPEETSREELEKLWVNIHKAKALHDAKKREGENE